MLEYTLDQAEDLLTRNFNQANLTMEQTDKDLDFLKYVVSIFLILLIGESNSRGLFEFK